MARKILLADDSVTAQNMGRKILADAGYEVITVNNGSAALKKIAEQKPDLIVLDVYMPGYSGLEVCQRLKEVPETARTPVLLTVGKLEPFKPDEARRVGAEGFIVKPFEASELLSALSKLEDKIVPRPESSKPGRFARTIASVEESNRFGKNSPSDEGSGWKNRIAFSPKKQKAAEAEEDNGEGPATYNAMSRDLRTVVDPTHPNKETVAQSASKESPRAEESTRQEGLADVTALATPGMPNDVTPDEIAAIAAAAAQVQSTILSASEAAETEPHPEAFVPADHAVESQAANKIEETIPAAPEVAREDRNEDRTEAQQEDRKIDREEEAREEEAVVAPANPADLIAALASLEPVDGHSWHAVQPGNHSGHSSEEPADVPVTMAVASAIAAGSAASRWTVVPMAIGPEEATVSLELEMQKAYAAFAAAEDQHRRDDAAEASGATENSQPISAAEPGPSDTSIPELELANAVSTAADAAIDAVGAPITELAAAATSYAEAQPALLAEAQQTPAASVVEVSPQTEAAAETAEFVSADGSSIADSARRDEQTARSEGQAVSNEVEKVFATNEAETQPDPSPIAAETAAPSESAVEGWSNTAEKKESDLVATTAAAWASWRQIRDTGSPGGNVAQPAKADKQEDEENNPAHSPESAAMAVAAGAEKSPEEAVAASSAESKAIANIVDSVLAELRPKIAEEIARKLSADKK